MSSKAERVKAAVTQRLNELFPLFVDEARLTFIMRVPGSPDMHMIITNDDNLDELAQLLVAQQ